MSVDCESNLWKFRMPAQTKKVCNCSNTCIFAKVDRIEIGIEPCTLRLFSFKFERDFNIDATVVEYSLFEDPHAFLTGLSFDFHD